MTTSHAQPIALESALLDPAGRAPPALLERLLADDFVEIGASGRRFGKAEAMAMLDAETGVRFETGAIERREIAPGVVLLLYASTRRDDAGAARRSLRSSLWVETPDGWRMVFHQGTLAPDAGASP